MSGRGRLLVVGTPIGNLGDLSPRAGEALRAADLIVAEDTRLTARLLAHLGARVATLSFNEHNAAQRLPELMRRLDEGQTLALTTDAGMPAVSDPGAALVAAAREAGASVESVPGPSAVTTAVALAGVEAPGFLFAGFLAGRTAGARRAELSRLVGAAREARLPLALYESPHRVRALLGLLDELVPGCQVAVARELTKRHEEVRVGAPSSVAAHLAAQRGEFVVVAWSLGSRVEEASAFDVAAFVSSAHAQGLSERTIVDLLRAGGVARREAYRLVSGR